MLQYIMAIKRGLRDVYGFKQKAGSHPDDPILENVPDGEYHLTIDGRKDRVVIKKGKIRCCNFEDKKEEQC